ncbi:hypothetical protein CK203_109978 [Vitis vinifera]|uniref:Uncharacterized protein n=1 Tax=Vitis vinifera TaxID=29760 RepID=A0A438DW63_VITVI|nr:hypothetical protein CK203_109978 [Vitis vinifera]
MYKVCLQQAKLSPWMFGFVEVSFLHVSEDGFVAVIWYSLLLAQDFSFLGFSWPQRMPSVASAQEVRKLEAFVVNRCYKRGLKPTNHSLLPDAQECVKNPPPL